jgi:hypothetical protein
MNERIRELAKQSGTWEYYEINEGVGEDEKHLEKFAELIIRECMDLLEDYTTDIHVGGIQYNVVGASETLQEYFGLKD